MNRPASVLITLMLSTLVALAPAPAAAITADYSHTPVLMIHGYFVVDDAGDATWSNFRKRLVADGWPDEYIYTPSFKDVRGCNEDHVNEIEAWVEDFRARTYSDKIDIVCHSFGCLNTLSWLKERCGVNRVRQYVGLAGAVHGTIVACADQALNISCAGKQMCIDTGTDGWKSNQLIVDENACDETPGDVQYTAVWTPYDEIIIPATGGQMIGANNVKIQTPFVEHGGIFLCDECYADMKAGLLGSGMNTDGPSWSCYPTCTPPEPEPVPEPVPEAATDTGAATDVSEQDVPAALDPGPADAPTPDLTPANDPGTAPDLEPDRAPTDDVPALDTPLADQPSTTADEIPAPRPKSSGCTAGADSSMTGLWFGLSMLVFGVARRRRLRS